MQELILLFKFKHLYLLKRYFTLDLENKQKKTEMLHSHSLF